MGYFVKKDKHGNKGFVLPAGPTSERPATPIEGLFRYNTTTSALEYYNGAAYVTVGATGFTPPNIDYLITDGITATFTMGTTESDHENIAVFLNGVYQIPGGTFAYTVSGFDLVFTSIPPNGIDITVVHDLYKST